jgi:5-methylcytosine-specific restriction endonuclease McrA
MSTKQQRYYEKQKAKKPHRPKHYLPRTQLEFKTQKELKAFIKSDVIAKYVDQKIDESHEAFPLMTDLYNRVLEDGEVYPSEYHIISKSNTTFSHPPTFPKMRGYEFNRVYAKRGDTLSCLSLLNSVVRGKKSSTDDHVRIAYRYTVEASIAIFRLKNPKCSRCLSENTLEVDHSHPEFKQLKNDFCKLHGTCAVQTEHGFNYSFIDPLYQDKWVKYHDAHAHLEMLCRPCHQKKTYEVDGEDFIMV